MTTIVSGIESGITVEVPEGTVRVSTENPFKTIFIYGGPTNGEVWLKTSVIGIVLPFLPKERHSIVDISNPNGRIWTGKEERDIQFVAPQVKKTP